MAGSLPPYARWVEANGNEGAAAFAYYLLLSFLPLVILLVTAGSLFGWMFALIFQLIPWLVLFYGLIMIYRLAPSRATRYSEVWLGALAATLLIWVGEWLFLLYGVHLTSFNALYGALRGAGGGPGEIRWSVATNLTSITVARYSRAGRGDLATCPLWVENVVSLN